MVSSQAVVPTTQPPKRQRQKVKTKQPAESDVTTVTGKRKRGSKTIDGVAKMSKRSVYELGEPKMSAEMEGDDGNPDAKKAKVLTVEVEESGTEFETPYGKLVHDTTSNGNLDDAVGYQ
jgi:hypothetical protein